MATYSIVKQAAYQPHLDNMNFNIQVLVDFPLICTQNGISSITAADVIQLIPVQEGMLITRVSAMIVVAEGANALGFDLGDGSAVNGFDDAVSLNATAGTITRSLEATDAYGIGRYYTAADTIDMVVNDSTVETGKILVIAEGFYVKNSTVQSTL